MLYVNRLYYGDNLPILRQHVKDETVDLVYLDPPFNSTRSYNVLFQTDSGDDAQAQIEAFDDTWTWSQDSELLYQELVGGAAPPSVADALSAIRTFLGTNDVFAYLVMMSARLLELHRALKPSGSLFLHCDPTASHYLKIVLDVIFGPKNFLNEIIWKRTGAHKSNKQFETTHDVILFYAKDASKVYFEPQKRPYTKQHVESRYQVDDEGRYKFVTGGNIMTGPGATGGESGATWRGFDPTARERHWAIPGYLAEQMPEGFEDLGVIAKLDALYEAGLVEIKEGATWPHPVRYLQEGDGTFIPDIWAYQAGTEGVLHGTADGIDADVQWLGPTSPERLGFQTQKPRGLLERIIRSACPEGGLVLDPFCGCGTTVAAAQHLDRSWIGIDITFLAIDLIQKRLLDLYGEQISDSYEAPWSAKGIRSSASPLGCQRLRFRTLGSIAGEWPPEREAGRGQGDRWRYQVSPQREGRRQNPRIRQGRQVAEPLDGARPWGDCGVP